MTRAYPFRSGAAEPGRAPERSYTHHRRTLRNYLSVSTARTGTPASQIRLLASQSPDRNIALGGGVGGVDGASEAVEAVSRGCSCTCEGSEPRMSGRGGSGLRAAGWLALATTPKSGQMRVRASGREWRWEEERADYCSSGVTAPRTEVCLVVDMQ
jgi:hypothetical protein